MVKTYQIILDTEKELYSPANLAFNISENDLDSVDITFTINQDNAPIDLTSLTVELAIKKPSTKTVYQTCEIIDPLLGTAKIILSNQGYIEFGVHTAEVYIRDINSLMVTCPFWYFSRSAVMNDGTLESENDWTALQEALMSYDLKPIVVNGFPTATPEYIGRMAFDQLSDKTYISNDLGAWLELGAGGGSGGGNDDIVNNGSPIGVVTPVRYGQIYIDPTAKAAYIATGTTNTDWEQIDNEIVNAIVDWADITNKPTTFPPSAHTHDYTTDITGKPSTFPPSAHTHPISDVTNLQSTLDGKAPTVHTHDYTTGITGKPSTFPPSAHTHVIADVTNLQSTLDGKAPTVHTHAIADVTGLQTALNGKAPTVHTHAISDVTNLQPALDGKAPTVHTHLWADITDKPTSFKPIILTGTVDPTGAPAYIGQTYINTTTKEAWIANSTIGDWQTISMDELGGAGTAVDWVDITNKPATFPPSVHTHAIADVTGLQPALDGKAPTIHTHLWADITDKPTTFTPSAHTHTIADVTNLQPTLDAKAPLASPTFTGTPIAPTPIATDNTTKIATTAFVKGQGYLTTAPVTSVAGKTGAVTLVSGDVGLGNVTNESKPTMFTDSVLTGNPTAPTPLLADNDTSIATTAFVKGQGYITTAPVTSVAGRTGAVTLTSADVGLGNVTNESKATMFTNPTFTGTTTGATINATTSLQENGSNLSAIYSPITHTHAYNTLTGIPATFAPSAHTHAIADVTGLQPALDGKVSLTGNNIMTGTYEINGTGAPFDLKSTTQDSALYMGLYNLDGSQRGYFGIASSGAPTKVSLTSTNGDVEIKPKSGNKAIVTTSLDVTSTITAPTINGTTALQINGTSVQALLDVKVNNNSTGGQGQVLTIWTGTLAQYNGLTKVATTLYIIQ